MTRRDPQTAVESDPARVGLVEQSVLTSQGVVVVRRSEGAGAGAGVLPGPARTPGDQPTALVLLHGAAGSWRTWTPVLRAAARQGRMLRDVVALDLPGWGDSPASSRSSTGPVGQAAGAHAGAEAPAAPRVRSDAPTRAALIREVLDALGHDRWHLVGHSSGGFAALDLAARYPDRVARVDLVSGTGAAVLDAIRRPLRGGLRLPGFAGMLFVMRLLSPVDGVGRALVRGLHRMRLLRLLARPVFGVPSRIHDTAIDALAEEVRPAAFALAARAARDYDEDSWRRIRCPVRALRGDRDVFVGEGDGARFAALIADFREETLPQTGHFGPVERPDAVLRLIQTRV